MLIDNCADINAKAEGQENWTPLLGIVGLLVNGDADVNAKDGKGRTLLHIAVKYSRNGVVRTLLREGAYVDTQNKEDNTPLHLAVEYGNVEVIELLLKNNANPNVINKYQRTPLDLARARAGQNPKNSNLV